jgi:L-cysteine/cystine lyase
MTLEEIRAELPVLQHAAYLNTGTFGPLPEATAGAMAEQERSELEEGRSGLAYWERARGLRATARETIARLIGAEAGDVAMTRSTTDGCNIVVAGLRLRPDDEIVTTDCEHFGLVGALGASPARVRVARIRGRRAGEALAAVEAEITPRTRLIAVSHVVWTTGQVMPVTELAGLGIPLLVDGAQGAGAVPVDVHQLGCDFYTVSGQKWLLGPDGTGALFVAPQRIEELAVTWPSYFSQQRFEPDGTFVLTEGAARFDNGTVPAPALAGLLQSLALAERAGACRFAQAAAMAQRCRELLAPCAEVVTEPGQSTLVSFRPAADAAETVARLAERGVVVRELPGLGWVRASVGYWTSEEDLARLVDGLGE